MTTYASRPDIAAQIVASVSKSFSDERADKTTDTRPHVSEVIHCLRKSWRERQPTHEHGDRATPENMTLLRGQAWDAIAERAAHDIPSYTPKVRVETPYLVGEIDAIWDNVIIDNKTTAAGPNGSKTSPADAPVRWPHYVEQVAAYAAMHGGVTQAALAVLYLPMPTTFKYWLLTFTEEELSAWLAELEWRSAQVSGPTEPSVQEHADWECQYCPFSTKKGGDCDGYGQGRPAGFFMIEEDECLSPQ